jgi:cell division septation protein DedD
MLPAIEKDEARARLAAVNAAAPEPAKPAPSPIRTASLPVSTPGATYTPPPVIAPAPAKPAPAKPAPALSTPAAVAAATAASEATAAATAAKGGAAPGTTYAAPPESGKLPPKPAPKPEPKPVKAAVAVHAGTSPWRAQFGAFGVEANARGLWKSLEKSYPALAGRTPVYAKAGTVTRLQTAGFASKADAESLCAAVRKGGQACLVVSQ